jgi:hypothetical protein
LLPAAAITFLAAPGAGFSFAYAHSSAFICASDLDLIRPMARKANSKAA